jgi:MFS transporter, ACS family, glucarate transporter
MMPPPEPLPGRISRVRWTLIGWMFVVSAIAYLDRVNISIAAQSLAGAFHFDNLQLGWVFSAFVIGYALFQAPGGAVADRFGPRAVLALGVVWWSVFTSLITILPAGWPGLLFTVAALRFALGMGEAVVYPASNCIVAAWIPSRERGMANGLIFAGVGVGAGVTPPLITYFLLHYGWRASFWASSAVGLLAGAVWYLVARDGPAQHPWVTPGEATFIEAGLPPASRRDHAKPRWGALLRNRSLLAITFAYFCYGYVAYIYFTWFFIYLRTARGLDLRQSSYYTMLPFLGMAIGSPLGGWVSDLLVRRWGKRIGRCYLAAASLGFASLFTMLGTRMEGAELASLVLACGVGALYFSQSTFWSASADIGGSAAGAASGFMNMGAQTGSAVTALVTPRLAVHFGWSASFAAAAALAAAGALAWLLVRPVEDSG